MAKPVTPYKAKSWQKLRNKSISKLEFPFQPYRAGQRDMMAHIYVAIRDGQQATIQAPTGIGKTLGTLFPAIKAMGEGHCDKIFFLAARTTGKQVASDALSLLAEHGLSISYVEITSKEKICFRSEALKECDGCPWWEGYEDRIGDALKDACTELHLSRDVVEKTARVHDVCPFELSLDASLLTDVIVCDYNYAFDPRVYLKRFFDEEGGKYVFLVDEAHNLVDRGRSMFSAELSREDLMESRRAFKHAHPKEARNLQRVIRLLKNLADAEMPVDAMGTPQPLVLDAIPEDILDEVRRSKGVLGEWLEFADNEKFRKDINDVYFPLNIFLDIADRFSNAYRVICEKDGKNYKWTLFCIDPSEPLGEAFKKAVSSICFSATISPASYFREVLGIEESARNAILPSPFPPENLKIIHKRVNTTFRNRDASLPDVVEAISEMVQVQPGNYMAFFPSYVYMDRAFHLFSEHNPEVDAFCQEPGMSEEDRLDFIATFEEHLGGDSPSRIGFAVLGGAFSEGIDLVGDRLVGVAVVGVGMPGIGVERDEIKKYYGDHRKGFQFSYTIPGIVKVLQAAGRVIRTMEDKGVVYLIDERYGRSEYRQLLPRHWKF